MPTIFILQEYLDILLPKLYLKKQDYFLGYYKYQKHQFIHLYTKHFSNVKVMSSQMAESSHGPIKTVINWYTPISNSFQ